MVTHASEGAQQTEGAQQATQTEAEGIHCVMQWRVSTTLETPESVNEVIDRGTHLEVAGWKVSKECLKEPTLPKGEIEINPEKADIEKPQAWSYLIDENTTSRDGKYRGFELWKRIFPWHETLSEDDAEIQGLFPITLWFYNYEGAKKEIKHRGEYFPSREELLSMVNSVSGNWIEKAKALKIPFAGCRVANGGGFNAEGEVACLWPFFPGDNVKAYYLYLLPDIDCALDNWGYYRGLGLLVRSFLDNKRV